MSSKLVASGFTFFFLRGGSIGGLLVPCLHFSEDGDSGLWLACDMNLLCLGQFAGAFSLPGVACLSSAVCTFYI